MNREKNKNLRAGRGKVGKKGDWSGCLYIQKIKKIVLEIERRKLDGVLLIASPFPSSIS